MAAKVYPGPLHCNFGSTAMSFHRATKQKLDKTFLLHTMSSTKVPRKVICLQKCGPSPPHIMTLDLTLVHSKTMYDVCMLSCAL